MPAAVSTQAPPPSGVPPPATLAIRCGNLYIHCPNHNSIKQSKHEVHTIMLHSLPASWWNLHKHNRSASTGIVGAMYCLLYVGRRTPLGPTWCHHMVPSTCCVWAAQHLRTPPPGNGQPTSHLRKARVPSQTCSPCGRTRERTRPAACETRRPRPSCRSWTAAPRCTGCNGPPFTAVRGMDRRVGR